MKDNISIIFAALVGVFLIVILPLFSILDRQDSMSYNVALTATTNFIDNVRNNGFIDQESYNNYLAALASTSNTYKVTFESYKKKLVRDTDEDNNIIDTKYKEEKELYNAYDIFNGMDENNAYLFNVDDEIYIRIHNTNLTAGSVLYRFLSGVTVDSVINISYGGVINNVNWEEYNKIASDTNKTPEVLMTVPVNNEGYTNIIRAYNSRISDYEYLEQLRNSADTDEEGKIVGLTEDEKEILNALEENLKGFEDKYLSLTGNDYAYLYDLTKKNNRTIKISLELKNITHVTVQYTNPENNELVEERVDLETLKELFNDKTIGPQIKDYLLTKIVLNGMDATKNISIRKNTDYYFFDIILKNVRLTYLDFISSIASITVLPGLGEDSDGTQSLGNDSVEIELIDESLDRSVLISGPYVFEKLKEENPIDSAVDEVFDGENVAFIISYKEISKKKDENDNDYYVRVKDAIKNQIKIHENLDYENLKINFINELIKEDTEDFKKLKSFLTTTAEHVIVSFKYKGSNANKDNFIELPENWIEIENESNIEDELDEISVNEFAEGAESGKYAVLVDDEPPFEPKIIFSGTLGENGWYTSDVEISLDENNVDAIKFGDTYEIMNSDFIFTEDELQNRVIGGSGVYKNYIKIPGATKYDEYKSEIKVSNEGASDVYAYSTDNVGNKTANSKEVLKIDKTAPTKPVITATGTVGNNGWYKSNVTIKIKGGTDNISKVQKTTYRITGENGVNETVGDSYTLTKEGESTVIARTYDNAGNYSEETLNIKIEKEGHVDANIEIISGSILNNSWYDTNVKLKITVSSPNKVSDLGTSKYRIKEKNSSDIGYIDFSEREIEKEITESGEYTITVIAYTKAGNSKSKEITVKIDKDSPQKANILVTGTEGENGWYTSPVNVQLQSNGDNGPSGNVSLTYILDDEIETLINSGESITISEDGEHILKAITIDEAGNRTEETKTIKIDKTDPTGDFKIIQTKHGDWYSSNVTIGYENVKDLISGIQNVELSQTSITEEVVNQKVTLTIKDNAGNIAVKETEISIDKTAPTSPSIQTTDPTGVGAIGVLLFNKNVDITITSGTDQLSDVMKTTYSIEKDGITIINEKESPLDYTLTENGYYIVKARTYDYAGNYSETSKVIWINKDNPKTPVITSINEINVKDVLSKNITNTDNNFKIAFENIEENSTLNITLTNQDNYEIIEKTFDNIDENYINISLQNKGKYLIKATQTNIFGSTSSQTSGTYFCIYE